MMRIPNSKCATRIPTSATRLSHLARTVPVADPACDRARTHLLSTISTRTPAWAPGDPLRPGLPRVDAVGILPVGDMVAEALMEVPVGRHLAYEVRRWVPCVVDLVRWDEEDIGALRLLATLEDDQCPLRKRVRMSTTAALLRVIKCVGHRLGRLEWPCPPMRGQLDKRLR